jgi:cation transport regulator ChaB
MPYARNSDLPESVRGVLPAEAQTTWRTIFNNAEKQYPDEEDKAFATAWAGLRRAGWQKGDDGTWHKVEKVDVVKVDTAQHLVFGWANVAIRKDGEQIEDLHGDLIDPDDLEQAAYQFVLEYRETGERHQGEAVGYLVESCCFTKEKLVAMGLDEDALPQGLWVGFYIPDAAVFAKVLDGTYSMFSIQGTAVPEEVA